MLHVGIANELESNTDTAAFLVDLGMPSRIYPLAIPQRKNKETQVPAVVYTIGGVERQVTYCGTSGLVRSDVRIDSYALKYNDVKDLAEAVRLVLQDFAGSLGGVVDVRHAKIDTETDLLEFEPGLFRVMQLWTFWHTEIYNGF